jgi:hypothetical protein
MSLDQQIAAKRLEIQNLKDEEERKRDELHALFLQKAVASCPISLGTRIEYEPNKYGEVDRIEYYADYLNELDTTAEVHWTVTGRKINKTGEYGIKEFQPVGPATHYFNGEIFTTKGIAGTLGINDGNA